ncbi:plasmid replication protein RepC [Rhizobium tumorigenes]|uniref:plasmid replication protein RepC n=1 Tax=Rhizobium tumorigenes TaxID=2041385 RepID=UPI00241DDBAD|nr:plasmid replication protein RepC [Rhizobium tumorigenes]WFS04160.1 plasmid replication protein RepC [Rhizobium tumorigenes]
MQTGSVTTPFGRRPMTLGMLASQYKANDIAPEQSVDKWKIFRALCEAKPLLGLSDRALAVLNALLSFYPGNELSAKHGLVVFPSNAQLSIRAHGIAPATLRRHLAALVEAGLLVRKDSPNGKRFARRDGEGEVDQAYGFNIAPLIARADEIQALAAQVTVGRALFRAMRERLSLCRRDIAKLIETALEEGVPGDWTMVHGHFRDLVARIPRSPDIHDITPIVEEMEMLREEVLNLLEVRLNGQNMHGNESHTERHIQNSNPESKSDLEPASKKKQSETSAIQPQAPDMPREQTAAADEGGERKSVMDGRLVKPRRLAVAGGDQPGLKAFPLGLVLQACPEILSYGPGGSIGSWRDLMAAAVVVRSMLGVSPSAYEEACAIMGPENAATVMACVLERAGSITSAGGYLRDLTRRTERGEFAIGPMLMSLARANAGRREQTG